MGILNWLFNALGDVLFVPLGGVHPVLVILIHSLLVAAGSLAVFKWTSDQAAIKAAKGPMKAHLLGVMIFRHDLRQVFRALGRALWCSITNMRFMVKPMAVMIVPLVLIFVQMELRLGMRPLAVGESTVVRVRVAPDISLDDIRIEAEEGLLVETPGVRVRDPESGLHEVDFRVRAVADGHHEFEVHSGGQVEKKSLDVGPGRFRLSPVRPRDIDEVMMYPAESRIGSGRITAIEVAYEPVTYAFLGIDWAWWVLFLVFMVLGLFLLKGPLGVDF